MEKLLKTIIHYSLFIIIFLLPLFFLPITQEFFYLNKLYLLAFGVFFLLLLSFIQFVLSKKISWQTLPSDMPVVLFLISIALSIIIVSPNKIQAILNPNFGLLMFFVLTLFYFYLSRQPQTKNFYLFLSISTLFLSCFSFIFFFQPLKNINLPNNLAFLKNPNFNPLGSSLDLVIFLGFSTLYQLTYILSSRQSINNEKKSSLIIHYSLLFIHLVAISLNLYLIFKPVNQLTSQPANQSTGIVLPPARLSWYAAVEILKQPLTAFFGVGVDSFSSIFTRVKDISYNQSPLWQFYSFNSSRSAILHLITETGLFGLASFLLILVALWKLLLEKEAPEKKMVFYYLIAVLLLFPSSLPVWFLFFFFLATSAQESVNKISIHQLNLAQFPPVVFSFAFVWAAFIFAGGYFLGRSYLAEYYYKKGLEGIIKNNAKEVYDNIRQAIILNPYIERFRVDFSQINLIIANNIVQRATQNQKNGQNQKQNPLTETDRQNISQAIQAAINEAKAAVSLNPNKAQYWENLANIYRNVINFAQQADLWTISAYQRSIVLDPQNPFYRLSLGGVYYSLANYEEASKIFEQVIALKPDWVVGHYNLAWADYQRGNYKRAVSEMENVLSLLDPKKDKVDYEKAKSELEEFKKKLPQEEKTATESGQPSQLNLPTPIPTRQPVINLPKEASPEAK